MSERDIPSGFAVSRAEIERMAAAAAVIGDCRRELATDNRTILTEILAGTDAIREWRHYPEGEVYDSVTHAQYFYHTHPAGERPVREHGHFHTFLRAEGMPSGIAPLVLPETAVAAAPPPAPQAAPLARGARQEVSHLVALALDPSGGPIRLFTTNRWVTGETWYRAEDVIAMLDRFAPGGAAATGMLDRWLAAMLALFRPQIAALLRRRDATVTAWRQRRRAAVFEDPRLEITSSLEIDLDAQLAGVDRLCRDLSRRPPDLPPMAEGWA